MTNSTPRRGRTSVFKFCRKLSCRIYLLNSALHESFQPVDFLRHTSLNFRHIHAAAEGFTAESFKSRELLVQNVLGFVHKGIEVLPTPSAVGKVLLVFHEFGHSLGRVLGGRVVVGGRGVACRGRCGVRFYTKKRHEMRNELLENYIKMRPLFVVPTTSSSVRCPIRCSNYILFGQVSERGDTPPSIR